MKSGSSRCLLLLKDMQMGELICHLFHLPSDVLIITVSVKEENYLTGYQMIYTSKSRNIPDGKTEDKTGKSLRNH